MPGVTMDEAVGCANPLLFFPYQQDGILSDPALVALSIWDVQADEERVAEVALDLADCPAGAKLGTGRFVPSFTPNAADLWTTGTHEIRWRFRNTVGGPDRRWAQRFEVLDPAEFPYGSGYVGYADSSVLKANDLFAALSIRQIQRLIDSASRKVELYTGRFFEPRFFTASFDSKGGPAVVLGHPVIGLGTLEVVGSGVADTVVAIDSTALRVYNRHLIGLLDPDDRDDPRVEFATNNPSSTALARGSFAPGRQNIRMVAVWGYTDPDGTPVGARPADLPRVVGALAAKDSLDPYGQDVSVSSAYRIHSAKTRDQAVSFFSPGAGGGGSGMLGPITGDRFIDDILIQLLRPPHMAAIGTTARFQSVDVEE